MSVGPGLRVAGCAGRGQEWSSSPCVPLAARRAPRVIGRRGEAVPDRDAPRHACGLCACTSCHVIGSVAVFFDGTTRREGVLIGMYCKALYLVGAKSS